MTVDERDTCTYAYVGIPSSIDIAMMEWTE